MSTGIKLRSLNSSFRVNRRFIGPLLEKVIHKFALGIGAGENTARFGRIDRKNGSGFQNQAKKIPNFPCPEIPLP
jgi:hypothetical protein